MRIITETERLILRVPTIDDAPVTFEIYGDAEVMKYVDDSVPFESVRQTEQSIMRGLEHQQKHGVCHWAVIEKASGKLIGHCGFNVYEGGPDIELVFHFNRRYWGQGFATEAARACHEYAKSHLSARRIVALTFPANTASIRVLEKIGMSYSNDVEIEGDRLRLYEYRSRSGSDSA